MPLYLTTLHVHDKMATLKLADDLALEPFPAAVLVNRNSIYLLNLANMAHMRNSKYLTEGVFMSNFGVR